MNVNSNGYTYTFATVMVILVAVLLSAASLGLKSKQENNVKQEKMQSILSSVGVQVDRSGAEEVYNTVIEKVLTIKGGEVVSEDRETGFSIDMAAAIKSSNMEREVPLYVANKDGQTYLYRADCAVKVYGVQFGVI
jgi:Na+-transporting NADH:ubiquinone oxidoreductase subunit C